MENIEKQNKGTCKHKWNQNKTNQREGEKAIEGLMDCNGGMM